MPIKVQAASRTPNRLSQNRTTPTEINRTFSKEEIQMGKKHMKKMFTISSHKGNANENHTKIPPNPVRIAMIQNTTNSRCW
jgi:hypothetical protein